MGFHSHEWHIKDRITWIVRIPGKCDTFDLIPTGTTKESSAVWLTLLPRWWDIGTSIRYSLDPPRATNPTFHYSSHNTPCAPSQWGLFTQSYFLEYAIPTDASPSPTNRIWPLIIRTMRYRVNSTNREFKCNRNKCAKNPAWASKGRERRSQAGSKDFQQAPSHQPPLSLNGRTTIFLCLIANQWNATALAIFF